MFLKSLVASVLNVLCPAICPLCGETVSEVHCLCPECYAKLHFISGPCCRICGQPFEYQPAGGLVCPRCLKKAPHYTMARSVIVYDDFSKPLILALKHGDHPEMAILLAKFMAQAEPALFQDIDAMIPVPLHWTRRFKRMYNQAGLLAKALGRRKGIPFLPNVLIRSRQTESQGHKTRNQREKNVRNAFRVKYPALIKGKRILLVDDVMTTGATLNECARVLNRAGAAEVRVITVYRPLK